jgi:hypothetical protein
MLRANIDDEATLFAHGVSELVGPAMPRHIPTVPGEEQEIVGE